MTILSFLDSRIFRSDGAVSAQYDYDDFSNLKKVTFPDGKVVEYKVDGFNRRVKKLVNGQVSEYYIWHDQTHLAAILDANKAAKIVYLYGPESNSPNYVIKDGVTYRILHDPGLGSIRYVINTQTKQIVQDIEYDEYGNVMKNTNPDFQPLSYAGGLFDKETGFIKFGARDYDSKIGRWVTKDPIGFDGGDTNLYAYVGGNPMSYFDPTGTTQQDIDNAIAFARKYNPSLANVKFGTMTGQNDGQTNLSLFGNHEILLNSEFLSVLSDTQKLNLLNTVFHEGMHVQQGFTGLYRNTFDFFLDNDASHNKIYRSSDSFVERHGQEFLGVACGKK